MKRKWTTYFVPALSLMAIAAVVTAALTVVHLLTKDVIATRAEETAAATRRQVINADTFKEKTLSVAGETIAYQEAYRDGTLVGYLFTTVTSGKSAGLTVMTGLALDGTITGLSVMENNETAGYVDKILADGLLERICQAGGPDVDVTTNATRTSRGVMAGVEQALVYYANLTKGGTAS